MNQLRRYSDLQMANMSHQKERETIILVRKHGYKATIYDLLYALSMISNLISICYLLAKCYNMKMTDNQIKVYDGEGIFILREPLEDNKTFKIDIYMVDHQCLVSTVKEDKNWLWHHMYGYLNFRSLSMLKMKNMVYGLPQTKKSSQMYEECC